jgi:hypothetical protein
VVILPASESTIVDLRAPLDITADPAKLAKDLEQTRCILLNSVVGIEDARWRVLSMVYEYNTMQGYTPAGEGPSWAGQVHQRGRDVDMELNRAVPSARPTPVIAKPTYSTPMKNLRAAHYITSELAGLHGNDLREKQA